MNKERFASILKSAQQQGAVLGMMLAAFWLISLVNLGLLSGALNQLGIAPRTVHGLVGVLLAPLLHGSFTHVTANTLPLLILAWLSMLAGLKRFALATACAWILGGLGTWLIASSDSVHIGASGLVFGYLGFLLTDALVQRSAQAIALSLVAAILYGGMIWGVLPGESGISWEGHLFGFLGGAAAARLMVPKVTSPTAARSPAQPPR
ncbi:MAG: rhomboid family intramembrane serine protease [Myxococcota bacterium]|jgi:membrane associated rhomboid family serine protease|nr:rhomboid family intramembrane serine protease [Myxococcota bacterium]